MNPVPSDGPDTEVQISRGDSALRRLCLDDALVPLTAGAVGRLATTAEPLCMTAERCLPSAEAAILRILSSSATVADSEPSADGLPVVGKAQTLRVLSFRADEANSRVLEGGASESNQSRLVTSAA